MDYRKFALIFVVCFLAFGIPTMAREDIDLQDYTSCDSFGFCKTEVDINELDLSKDGKDLLKSIESDTPVSIETSDSIENFSIEIVDREKLLVTGHVYRNTYWTADFGDVFLDPWFNYTTYSWNYYNWTNPASSCGTAAAGGNLFGVNLTTTSNNSFICWINIKATSSGFSWLLLTDSAGNIVKNTTDLSSANFTLNATSCVAVNTSQIYRIVSNPTTRTSCSGVSFPYVTPAFSITHGVYCSSGNPATCSGLTGEIFEISSIGYKLNESSEVSIWYNTHLYLNGSESNVSINTANILNSTATTNLTGVTTLIYINGTLSANNTTTATNETLLSLGMWNITAWIGNASTNGTITWWANVTTAPVTPSEVVGYIYCFDNTTLAHINVTNLQTDNVITYYEHCRNGCDNVTATCNQPQFIQDILNIVFWTVVVAIIVFAGSKLGKRRRR